jgi:hypothetical protein
VRVDRRVVHRVEHLLPLVGAEDAHVVADGDVAEEPLLGGRHVEPRPP